VIEIIEGQWFNPDQIVSVKSIGPKSAYFGLPDNQQPKVIFSNMEQMMLLMR
jgi:hypothetical protein